MKSRVSAILIPFLLFHVLEIGILLAFLHYGNDLAIFKRLDPANGKDSGVFTNGFQVATPAGPMLPGFLESFTFGAEDNHPVIRTSGFMLEKHPSHNHSDPILPVFADQQFPKEDPLSFFNSAVCTCIFHPPEQYRLG